MRHLQTGAGAKNPWASAAEEGKRRSIVFSETKRVHRRKKFISSRPKCSSPHMKERAMNASDGGTWAGSLTLLECYVAQVPVVVRPRSRAKRERRPTASRFTQDHLPYSALECTVLEYTAQSRSTQGIGNYHAVLHPNLPKTRLQETLNTATALVENQKYWLWIPICSNLFCIQSRIHRVL